jgi:acyl-CoA thioesterase I
MKYFLMILLYLITLPVLAKNTILIVGDSISAGYGIEPNQGWVHLLQQRLAEQRPAIKIINASISGDTTSNGLARLPKALQAYQPMITIIELGGNDGLRGLSLATIKQNLQHMIDLVHQAKSKTLLLGIRIPANYGPNYTLQFQDIFRQLCHDNAIACVPLFLQGIDDRPQLMQADKIHPTAAAQAQLLDNVWPVLQGLLPS